MGLSNLDPDNDKVIKQGKDFATRKELQDLVLTTNIGEKPDGPNFGPQKKLLQTPLEILQNVTCK